MFHVGEGEVEGLGGDLAEPVAGLVEQAGQPVEDEAVAGLGEAEDVEVVLDAREGRLDDVGRDLAVRVQELLEPLKVDGLGEVVAQAEDGGLLGRLDESVDLPRGLPAVGGALW